MKVVPSLPERGLRKSEAFKLYRQSTLYLAGHMRLTIELNHCKTKGTAVIIRLESIGIDANQSAIVIKTYANPFCSAGRDSHVGQRSAIRIIRLTDKTISQLAFCSKLTTFLRLFRIITCNV